jgi:hypothetical protein
MYIPFSLTTLRARKFFRHRDFQTGNSGIKSLSWLASLASVWCLQRLMGGNLNAILDLHFIGP